MKTFCLLLMGLMGPHWMAPAQTPARKVVFVIADGIPADVLEAAPAPHIKKIIAGGTYLRAHVGGAAGTYTETPTISAPGYNDLLTGTWGYKHNVWDNAIAAPNYNYPTIFRLVKEAQPARKIAIFSTWTDNRTKLVGEGLPTAGNLRFDYKADGYELDTTAFRHDKASRYTRAIDDRVVAEAAQCLRAQGPDLSWVYLEHTDDVGHRHGDGDELRAAVGYLDAQIGQLQAALVYRRQHFREDWLLVLTTDHGRDATTGRNHGGQSARERTTWLVLSAKDVNAAARQQPVAIVDILPTIARFLQVPLPVAAQRELDGVPLLGPVSVAAPQVRAGPDSLRISWAALGGPAEPLKVWATATNRAKTGGADEYTLLGTVPLGRQRLAVGRATYPAAFYKIVLEGAHNTANAWLMPPGPPAPGGTD
ncbi:alkaline phosphatase family protein [Hymenobacter nivis]|uniref:Nucleotide pyrophosphatase n=1 Tax=Hymenobacter nivis TaxID=1850093 RepID=A0A2Z3GJL2_9BACT|nr:alkaline phosphatase family protein [Hymenobacter nivis]AWM31877.1 nucleotide pyrophosphatase [Hymenobacter nivis]